MQTTSLRVDLFPIEGKAYGPPAPPKAVDAAQEPSFLFGDDGFSFKDILDVINPLQQLPIISTFYRDETGDTISPASRIAGGALLGGPFGAIAALANTVIEEVTGDDAGGSVIAAFAGDSEKSSLLEKPDNPMPVYGRAARGGYSAYVRAQSLLN